MKTPKILVISGRKQAGKNTLSNFVEGIILLQQGIIDHFEVSERTNGKLYVGNELCSYQENIQIELLKSVCTAYHTNQYIQKYEIMDDMKHILVNYFGLSREEVSGENGSKDILTRYLWENMPGLSETPYANRRGKMTARQFMQYVGTEVARKIHPDINIENTYKNIKRDQPEFATINGARFPNDISHRPDFACEIKTIRLARTMYPDDTHSSETSLDVGNFNWNLFDAVIWNQRMSIEQTCAATLSWLRVWGWVK
jgi:hypothetical protein